MNSIKSAVRSSWQRTFLIIVALLGFWVTPSQSDAITTLGGGREWLQWTSPQRESYVIGWFRGMDEGFMRGCTSGLDANKERNPDEDLRFGKECMSRSPLRGSNPDRCAGLVTQFYRKYPEQRLIRVEEILIELAKGHNVEEVHNHFLYGHY
jgi:hypothetical protein